MESLAFDDEQMPTRMGRYELIRRIAVGGMAEIFLARAGGLEGFEKLLVLKRVLPQYAGNAEFTAMFIDEARLVAGLSHPNIAQVYDIGVDDAGNWFFAMEFVDGEDVRQILRACARKGEGLPFDQAVAITVGIAAGLHAAHERRGPDGKLLGIVHRDVSPSNVLCTYDGCIKLVDFGIAKSAQRQAVTRTGVLKGKCAYMSPEQTRGDKLDRRSDVFAIGILLYELTCGRRPFSGESEYATMRAVVNDAPAPPTQVVPGYPAALERVVLRALAKDPKQRYQTARALQVDLEKAAREEGLDGSAVALGDFMQGLFAEKLTPPPVAEPGQSLQLSRVLRGLTSDGERRAPSEPKARPSATVPIVSPSAAAAAAERRGGERRGGEPRGSAPMNLTSVSIQFPREPSVYSLTQELADTPTVLIERRAGEVPVVAPSGRRGRRRIGGWVAAALAVLLVAGAGVAGWLARPLDDVSGDKGKGAPVSGAGAGERRGEELPSPRGPALNAVVTPPVVEPAAAAAAVPAEGKDEPAPAPAPAAAAPAARKNAPAKTVARGAGPVKKRATPPAPAPAAKQKEAAADAPAQPAPVTAPAPVAAPAPAKPKEPDLAPAPAPAPPEAAAPSPAETIKLPAPLPGPAPTAPPKAPPPAAPSPAQPQP